MERARATDFPQELLNLFDHYVHGEISRRRFLDGAAEYPVGGLTAMTIWDSLRPNYAFAEKVPKDDKRLERNMRLSAHHKATAASVGISFAPRALTEDCLACL